MLRRGGGEDNNLGNDGNDNHKSNNSSSTTTTTTTTPSTKLRGLLKLLKGQICNPNTTRSATDDTVSVFSYDADVLLETHKEFKKRRKRSSELPQHSSSLPPSLSSFEDVIGRHRFVCFFVIQGRSRRRGRGRKKNSATSCYSSYYCTHTLNLRKVIATEYHDVMSTFVIDIGSTFSSSSNNNNNKNVDNCASVDYNNDPLLPLSGNGDDNEEDGRQDNIGVVLYGDEEPIINDRREEDEEDFSSTNDNFCAGTGFTIFPSTVSTSTILAILNVSKIPSVVVIDTTTGRIVSRDAILAIEKNNSHTVINRWQSGKSGLSLGQSICAAVTCQSDACCAIQ
jgi:hypothetical protein